MDRSDDRYRAYLELLERELVPAMGCTEPVALAFGAARARELLGALPDRVTAVISGNIIKNAKSVTVPNTGGMKGIPAAIAAGLVAGRADRLLEVLSDVTEPRKQDIRAYLDTHEIKVELSGSGLIFDIELQLAHGGDTVRLRICNEHTNIVLLEKNGETLLSRETAPPDTAAEPCGAELDIQAALEFAETVELAHIQPLIRRQIEYNSAIAQEGLKGGWGASIGKVLAGCRGSDVWARAKAMAAAGSDARMGGCELPVIILSGSGNQGMTASLPVLEYARELDAGWEKTVRAVALSDLLTLHQKRYIGRLSAFCGVVCAGAGASAAIAYLHGGGYREVSHALVNTLAISSGIVCDGAKPSCAAKIAMAVEAGLLGYFMFRDGQQFYGGDGIVKKGAEATISQVGRLGREGMRQTDLEILKIMLD